MADIPDKYQRKKDYASIMHKEEPKPAFSSTIFDSNQTKQEVLGSTGKSLGGVALDVLFVVFIISIFFGVLMVATTVVSNTLSTNQQVVQQAVNASIPAQTMQPLANQSNTIAAYTALNALRGQNVMGGLAMVASFTGIIVLLAVVTVVIFVISHFLGGMNKYDLVGG